MSSTRRVVPFGNPRIKGYLHLPGAYRSLSRPSSPPRAKASAMRPSLLSLFIRPHLRVSGMIYTFSSLLLKLLFACTICHRSVIFVSYVSDGVENNGFEPLTPCLQSRCSSQLSYRTKFNLVCFIRPGFLLSLFRLNTESYLE